MKIAKTRIEKENDENKIKKKENGKYKFWIH